MSWTSPPTDQPAHVGEHHLHLPDAAHVMADRRGLTATGAVAIALVLGFIGAAIDVKTGHGLRMVFAVCFIGGSALAAAIVHREDLRAAVMIPPFTYCALAVIGGFIGSTTVAGSRVTKARMNPSEKAPWSESPPMKEADGQTYSPHPLAVFSAPKLKPAPV